MRQKEQMCPLFSYFKIPRTKQWTNFALIFALETLDKYVPIGKCFGIVIISPIIHSSLVHSLETWCKQGSKLPNRSCLVCLFTHQTLQFVLCLQIGTFQSNSRSNRMECRCVSLGPILDAKTRPEGKFLVRVQTPS